jgi:hypothetical protein
MLAPTSPCAHTALLAKNPLFAGAGPSRRPAMGQHGTGFARFWMHALPVFMAFQAGQGAARRSPWLRGELLVWLGPRTNGLARLTNQPARGVAVAGLDAAANTGPPCRARPWRGGLGRRAAGRIAPRAIGWRTSSSARAGAGTGAGAGAGTGTRASRGVSPCLPRDSAHTSLAHIRPRRAPVQRSFILFKPLSRRDS